MVIDARKANAHEVTRALTRSEVTVISVSGEDCSTHTSMSERKNPRRMNYVTHYHVVNEGVKHVRRVACIAEAA